MPSAEGGVRAASFPTPALSGSGSTVGSLAVFKDPSQLDLSELPTSLQLMLLIKRSSSKRVKRFILM